MSESLYCPRQHGQLENIVMKLDTTKSIIPECLAVEPENDLRKNLSLGKIWGIHK